MKRTILFLLIVRKLTVTCVHAAFTDTGANGLRTGVAPGANLMGVKVLD